MWFWSSAAWMCCVHVLFPFDNVCVVSGSQLWSLYPQCQYRGNATIRSILVDFLVFLLYELGTLIIRVIIAIRKPRVKRGIYKNKFVYEKPISVWSQCISKDMATVAKVILVCTWYVSGPSSLIYTRHAWITTQISYPTSQSFIFGFKSATI